MSLPLTSTMIMKKEEGGKDGRSQCGVREQRKMQWRSGRELGIIKATA
jgi:hypothetical protein